MSAPSQPAALTLPRLSPSRVEAWDRCPAAYPFAHVLRLPQPVRDQRPRLLGSVAHILLERYLQETLRSGTRPPLAMVSALATALVEEGNGPDASTELIREATELVTRWVTQWAVPVEHLVAVETRAGRGRERPPRRVGGAGRLHPRPPRSGRGRAAARLWPRLEERLGQRGRGGLPRLGLENAGTSNDPDGDALR
jgi:PD-(D/E)XK nuclease superfamily